ncbi:Beta-carotene isomerase [Actinidia chinensis var. chinensis]|uniref:Beta-carotene isomerase n=1 Tax=Actinidia chinensis var. chinensis TaxID=1590841 RepID=A0A2R6P666_ACTCC|nr:Beta-carotene isomerase [Actinidia chinensis var. chinensis]
METLLVQYKSPFLTLSQRRHIHQAKHPPILSILTRPTEDVERVSSNSKTVYNDNWFNLIAINHLSKSVQATTGLRNSKSGYESLVEAATAATRSFNPIRTLLPNSKFAREYFAIFTTVFFKWLVGPSEVRESELNGSRERNVVHIKKCRFLEESNCVGMCINLCKMPSQTFIKDSLGMPINMVPNFDDMSCEMIYGQDPPSTAEDPVFKQPCYKLCKINQKHNTICSS